MAKQVPWKSMLLASLLLCVGCASSGGRHTSLGIEPGDDTWEKSQARPASYGTDSFTVQKEMPIGEKKSLQFFTKTCDEDGHGTWMSKTSYSCTDR
jgi:hypothetical protein